MTCKLKISPAFDPATFVASTSIVFSPFTKLLMSMSLGFVQSSIDPMFWPFTFTLHSLSQVNQTNAFLGSLSKVNILLNFE